MTNEPINADMFSDLVGYRVEILSISASTSYKDIGVLQATAHPWIRIILDTGEVMCFNAYHIRYIKTIR